MPFWTSILHCADGSSHTVPRDNPGRRIGEHRTDGACDVTRRRIPMPFAARVAEIVAR